MTKEIKNTIRIEKPKLKNEEIRDMMRKYEIDARNEVEKIMIPYEYKQDVMDMATSLNYCNDIGGRFMLYGAMVEFY